MPTLTRLLFIVAAIALAIYATMAALVFLVQPTPQPMEVEVPLPQLQTPQQPVTQPAPGGAQP
jgi:hypothetical protein